MSCIHGYLRDILVKELGRYMDREKIEKNIGVALGMMSIVAIIGIIYNGTSGIVDYFNAMINFTQVAIPVIVLLVTARGSMTYVEAGRKALEEVRHSHNQKTGDRFRLDGPRYAVESKEKPEAKDQVSSTESDRPSGGAKQYLFLSNRDGKNKAAFVPLNDLEYGVLTFSIRKTTVDNALKGAQGVTPEAVAKAIHKALMETTLKNYDGLYEIVKSPENVVSIDFNETEFSKSKFAKAVRQCTETALNVIKSWPGQAA